MNRKQKEFERYKKTKILILEERDSQMMQSGSSFARCSEVVYGFSEK